MEEIEVKFTECTSVTQEDGILGFNGIKEGETAIKIHRINTNHPKFIRSTQTSAGGPPPEWNISVFYEDIESFEEAYECEEPA